MAKYQGQDTKITFGDVDLTADFRAVNVGELLPTEPRGWSFQATMAEVEATVTELLTVEDLLRELSTSPAAEFMDLWPWGRRWYLPCYKFRAELDPDTLEFHSVGEIELVQDERIHARLLRRWWIKVRCPIKRWVARRKEADV